jgi:hypothetical protein
MPCTHHLISRADSVVLLFFGLGAIANLIANTLFNSSLLPIVKYTICAILSKIFPKTHNSCLQASWHFRSHAPEKGDADCVCIAYNPHYQKRYTALPKAKTGCR